MDEIKIKLHNYYGWKNYHAGMDLTVSKGNKKVKVRTSGYDKLINIVQKICEVSKCQC